MKKLLLINPPIPDFVNNRQYQIPISLLYLAHHIESTLTAEVKVYDFSINNYKNDILNAVKGLDSWDYIGFGCLFSGMFPFIDSLSKEIKTINNNIKIIIGGIHPTLFGEEIIRNCPNIDFVVTGEGEVPLREIISDKKNISNTYYRNNGEICFNDCGILVNDINMISPPWMGIEKIDLDDYRQDLSDWNNPKKLSFDISIPIVATRGCPNDCNFCSVYRMTGKKIRARTYTSVVNEMEWFYKKHNCNRFSFYDDNTIGIKGHMESICSEIINRKLNIQFDLTNGFPINKITNKLIDLMVEAGWVRGILPIESGNDTIRNKIIKKRLSKEKIFETVDYIKDKYPFILLRAVFMMGLPEDTNKTLQDTYDMIEKLNVDSCRIQSLIPFPGTPVFYQCIKDGLFLEEFSVENYWNYNRTDFDNRTSFYIKPYGMTYEELVEWRKRFDKLISRKESTLDKSHN